MCYFKVGGTILLHMYVSHYAGLQDHNLVLTQYTFFCLNTLVPTNAVVIMGCEVLKSNFTLSGLHIEYVIICSRL